jgi:hypothetical protein
VTSESSQQSCEQGGTFGQGANQRVLAGGVRAVADSAETIQSGNAEGGSEIAVRASAGGTFRELQSHLAH